jgi:phosphotriesterase-related protein
VTGQFVETVLGRVSADALGLTLTHEHLFVGWPGWQYDPVASDQKTAGYETLLARLREARAAGVATIVDATPADLGRDAALLRRAAQDSGINVIASTGYYHEAWGLPVYLRMRSVDELTEILLHDLQRGMEGTDVRAGAIKLASAGQEIGRHEQKALLAAAAASRALGVAILTHAPSPAVAVEQASRLIAEGVAPERVQIGHCDSFAIESLRELLDTGVFVAFDQVAYEQRIDAPGRVRALSALIEEGFARQLTLSHDQIGILGGRQVTLTAHTREFSFLVRETLPALRGAGVSDEAIATMTVANPARWLGHPTAGAVLKELS